MTRQELLKQLYSVHSPSGQEKRMRKFIRRQCKKLGCSVSQDNYGNLYVVKGESDTYPCVVAHMDQVQSNHSKDFHVYIDNDVIFGFSPKSKAIQGLGADDKNGIWVALCLLEDLPALKAAFFVEEEIGCLGSGQADMGFFKDVRFVLQADRRGSSDLITDISGQIASEEFLADIPSAEYGYKPTIGMMTDVLSLCQKGVGVSCINFSCGYYSPHTDQETTVWSELVNALAFARAICIKCTNVYPHEYTPYWTEYYTGKYYGRNGRKYDYGSYDYYDWYDDYYGGYKAETAETARSKSLYQDDDVKKQYDADDYFEKHYESDFDKMKWIFREEGDVGAEKIIHDYKDWFYTNDNDIICCLYDDAKAEVLK